MIRVLHVIGGMDRGGAETWLMHVIRHIDREQFHLDLLVHTTKACAYDEEIRDLGSRIIPCTRPSAPLAYSAQFLRIIRTCGPYDVVHSHVHHFSGYVLKLAWQAHIPLRIAHSHSDTTVLDRRSGLARRCYLTLMRRWIEKYATTGLAVSQAAAATLFGLAWATDSRRRILPSGIDLDPFQIDAGRDAILAELGIPKGATVVGHVGRFVPSKNHRFLVEIFVALTQVLSEAHLIFVGDGPTRPEIEALIHSKCLTNRVHFLGVRSDVAKIMSAFDIFFFPSVYEGLGMVVLEAQAAGVPCVVASSVPCEVDIGIGLVQFVSLQASSEVWVQSVLDGIVRPRPNWFDRKYALVKAGRDIQHMVLLLQQIYSAGLTQHAACERRL